MQVVVRTYSRKGGKERHKGEIEKIIRPVKGFVSYTLARSGDGGFSVTVCQDKAGINESVQIAKDWIAKNAANAGAAAPKMAEGSVIVHLK